MIRKFFTLLTIKALLILSFFLIVSTSEKLPENSNVIISSHKKVDNSNNMRTTQAEQHSDEANFQLFTFISILSHQKFGVEVKNKDEDKSFKVISECLSQGSLDSAAVLPSCTLTSQNMNKNTQQDLFLDKASEYTFDSDKSVLKVRNVPSKITKKTEEGIASEKNCNTDAFYSFINAKTNQPFAYSSDKAEDLSIKVEVSGGNCDADNVTPLLKVNKPDDLCIYGYLAVMVLLGMIQAVTCGVLVIQIEKNNNMAKSTSLGTLSMLISFDLCIYLQHFTYWTTISNLMIIAFVLFFVISVFFEPAVLYFVFSTLQRRQNIPVRSLLMKLYFWLAVSAVGVIITQTFFSEYIYIAYALCLIPQIIDSMLQRQKYKWNYTLLIGLGLPKLIYMMMLTFNSFDLFATELSPSVSLFVITAIVIELLILKIQRKWPGLGIVKKCTKNEFSYECQSDEVEAVSQIVCSICTEKVGSNPIIGQQPTQDQEEAKCEPVMKTPCLHYYHESCLKEWFKKKFECPNCRQMLPPLENDDEE